VGLYYYLMAQLPHLVYEQKPPMSSNDFLELAKPLMSKSDRSFFDKITLSSSLHDEAKTGCGFIDNWRTWERSLKLNLAKQRAIKLKRDNIPMEEPPATPLEAVAAASKAVDESSPLDGELLLDKARWYAIESLVGNNYFDRSNVYAYFLKLLIIERREAFNVEKGFTEYKSLYASIVESGQETRGVFA